MQEPITRRGVYKDLELSPYSYKTEYGDLFKFRSAKKLEIYARDIEVELERLEKIIDRNQMRDFLPVEIIQLLRRAVYRSFYERVEG